MAAAADEVTGLSIRVEPIERAHAPSPEEFARRYRRAGRPVILTGLTEGWLPSAEWAPRRVAMRYGSARVVAAELENGTLRDDPREGVVFRRVEIRSFVESMSRPGSAAHYVMAPLSNLPDAIEHDYQVPIYCRGAPHLQAKLWIGKADTVTPTHRDVPHNLNVHLFGRKRWLLFSPAATSCMYSRGLLSGMPNFSSVDPEHPDYERYPRFRRVSALGGTVGPGETLVIPHGWWHHTRSLDDAVAINFWWGGRFVSAAARASSLFKRMRGIRRDEWGE